jgi:glycogen synthase
MGLVKAEEKPSHGRATEARPKRVWTLPFESSEVARRGVDGSLHPHTIGMEEGHFERVRYLLAKGLDQKGVDALLKVVPEVPEVFPDAKLLLLLVPLFSRELVDSTVREAKGYEKSVRVVLGRAEGLYRLAHISADAYAMPSRWEPFGITALEATATGNRVVGSRVGGTTETVLDMLERRGTEQGVLCRRRIILSLQEGSRIRGE